MDDSTRAGLMDAGLGAMSAIDKSTDAAMASYRALVHGYIALGEAARVLTAAGWYPPGEQE
jgi:hypothetical protein